MYRIKSSYFIYLLCLLALLCTCTTISAENKKNLQVEITTHLGDGQEYIEGDEISFLVNVTRDAYLLILYKDASQKLWQLLPNDFNQQAKVGAGLYIPIPGPEQNYRFRASAPFGKETLIVYASESPFQPLKNKATKNGLPLLGISPKKLANILSDASVVNKTNLATSTLNFITQKQP